MTRNSPTLGTSNSYVASTLRKDFQISFVIYTLNTPVGCTNVNSIKLINSKGNSAFPLKNKSPSGATAGGIPPKMVPFFRKNSPQKVLSTPRPKFWVSSCETQAARGRRSASRG
jgi:hypothetical protein